MKCLTHAFTVLAFCVAASMAVPQLAHSQANADSYGTGTLSPICSGGAWKVSLSAANESKTVGSTTAQQATTYPFLDCFGYLRLPKIDPSVTMGTADQQLCQHAADLTTITLHLISSATDTIVTSVPLDWIFGDAIHGTAYAMPEPVYVNIDLMAPPFPLPSGCSIEVQYSLPTTVYRVTTKYVTEKAPRLHDLSPWIALKGQEQTFRFVRPKSSSLVSGGTNADRFFIASQLEGCFSGPGSTTPLDSTAYPSYTSVAVPTGYNFSNPLTAMDSAVRGINPETEVFATWNYTFENHGAYFICVLPYNWVSPSSQVKALEVGSITVFGGNPAFYTIEGQTQGSARLQLNTKYVFVMEGVALDLRPGRDQAKFVDPAESDCTGKASHQVGVGTDLGPSDDFGHNVTFAKWEVTFRQGGSFWVCYKRYGSIWSRVFPLSSLSSGSQQYATNLTHLSNFHRDDTFAPQPQADGLSNSGEASGSAAAATTTTTTSVPLATFTPVPGSALQCLTPSSEFTYDPSTDPGSWVALGVRDSEFYSQGFAQTVADVLCLNLQLVYISPAYQESSRDDQWEIRVALSCVKECNNAEKLSYLVWLFSAAGQASSSTAAVAARNALVSQGVQGAFSQSSRSSTLEVAEKPAEDTNDVTLTVIIAVLCLLLVIGVVATIAVVCIMRRHKKREQRANWQFDQNNNRGTAPIDGGIVVEMDDDGSRIETEEGVNAMPGAAWDVEVDPAAKPSM